MFVHVFVCVLGRGPVKRNISFEMLIKEETVLNVRRWESWESSWGEA